MWSDLLRVDWEACTTPTVGLPPNLGWLVLRLAKSTDKELRWRMVQNFEHGSPSVEAVPVLVDCLSDRYRRVRNAAAHGLACRGPVVLDWCPDCADLLIDALGPRPSSRWGSNDGLDSDASPCGHIAHLLACGADRLTAGQRQSGLRRGGRQLRRTRPPRPRHPRRRHANPQPSLPRSRHPGRDPLPAAHAPRARPGHPPRPAAGRGRTRLENPEKVVARAHHETQHGAPFLTR